MDNGLMLAIMNYGALLGDPTVEYYVISAISGDTGDEMIPIWIDPMLNEMLGASGWVEDIFATIGSNEFPIGLPNDSECALDEGMDPIPVGEYNDVLSNIINCVENTEVTEKELSGTFNATSFKVTENCNTDLLPFIENNKEIVTRINVNVRPVLQPKNITPTTNKQTVKCDEGYDGLSQVTIDAVTSAIDANIKPENIAAGKTILGVYGTYKALIDDYVVRLVDIPADNYNNLNKFKSLQFFWPKTIGDRAFYGCSDLKRIWFASTPTSIGSEAFAKKHPYNNELSDSIILDKLDIPNLAEWFKMSIAEDMNLCSKTICVNNTEITSLTIPDDVTELQPWVCAGWLTESVNEVYLPSGLTKIGASAFVTTDTIEVQKSVYIDSLEHWLNIEFVNMDSNPIATTKGNLYINNELIPNELVFDENVTEIKPYTFANFKNLTSISGENVTKIGSGAFCNYGFIKTVNFPNVTSIGKEAFAYLGNNQNYGSIKMKFPKLSTISDGAFRGCDNLRVLDIGGSPYSFSEDTFFGCDNLYTLVLRGSSVVKLSGFYTEHHFRGTPFEHGSGTLYVPDDLVSAYRDNYDWKEILKNPTSQVKPLSEYVE